MKIGLVINPFAGIGGSVALKGSDGSAIVEQALALGAKPQAQSRAEMALSNIVLESSSSNSEVMFYTASGSMGEDTLRSLKHPVDVIYNVADKTTAEDTKNCINRLLEIEVDLILFVGGDGTARDVLDVISKQEDTIVPVIGIPAGVKIHSAVYALSPNHAGELINKILNGELMSVHDAQVMDLDEKAFREGKVIASCYGYLSVPVDDTRMQLIKQGGINHDEVAVQDIATEIIESMEDDVFYIIGSGSTTAEIMNQLSLENTLLGIDIVCNHQLINSDVDEKVLLEVIAKHKVKIVVTIIGGQGHIFGRGNQQLSASVLNQVEKSNIIIIASNDKLRSLDSRPMISDTGDLELDKALSGLYSVVTGYQQKTLYRLN